MELKKKDLKQKIIENIDHRLKEEKNLLKRADSTVIKSLECYRKKKVHHHDYAENLFGRSERTCQKNT